MTVVNRTSDFRRVVATYSGSSEKTISNDLKNNIKPSDFAKVTSALSANVHATSQKLQTLTKCMPNLFLIYALYSGEEEGLVR